MYLHLIKETLLCSFPYYIYIYISLKRFYLVHRDTVSVDKNILFLSYERFKFFFLPFIAIIYNNVSVIISL